MVPHTCLGHISITATTGPDAIIQALQAIPEAWEYVAGRDIDILIYLETWLDVVGKGSRRPFLVLQHESITLCLDAV